MGKGWAVGAGQASDGVGGGGPAVLVGAIIVGIIVGAGTVLVAVGGRGVFVGTAGRGVFVGTTGAGAVGGPSGVIVGINNGVELGSSGRVGSGTLVGTVGVAVGGIGVLVGTGRFSSRPGIKVGVSTTPKIGPASGATAAGVNVPGTAATAGTTGVLLTNMRASAVGTSVGNSSPCGSGLQAKVTETKSKAISHCRATHHSLTVPSFTLLNLYLQTRSGRSAEADLMRPCPFSPRNILKVEVRNPKNDAPA